MKKLVPIFMLVAALVGCESEDPTSVTETPEPLVETEVSAEVTTDEIQEIQQIFLDEIENLDLKEIENLDFETIQVSDLNDAGFSQKTSETGRHHRTLTSLCVVKDADRCPFGDQQPVSNMWWPENDNDFFVPSAYFSSSNRCRMIFATFSDGTALIRGITLMNEGDCTVYVNVWLKDRQSFDEFSATGGEFKLEPGCASQEANPQDLAYYDIDASRSWIYSWGDDCLGSGAYGLELRGDEAPDNFRAQLGTNGAGYDSNIGAFGFSSWGYITDWHTNERLWVMDFDFRLQCCPANH